MNRTRFYFNIIVLIFIAIIIFSLIRYFILLRQGYEFESENLEQTFIFYTIAIIWSLITMPIILWARYWGKVQFWYWIGTFFYYITPIIILFFKKRKGDIRIRKDGKYFDLSTIVNYLLLNLLVFNFAFSASLQGYNTAFGLGSTLIGIVIIYSTVKWIRKKNEQNKTI